MTALLAKLPSDPAQLRRLASTYGMLRARLLRGVNDGLSEPERVELLMATFDLAEVKLAQNDEHAAVSLYESGVQLGLIFVSPRYPLIDQQLRRVPTRLNHENHLAQLIHKLSADDKKRLFTSLSGKQKDLVAKALNPRDRRLLGLQTEDL